MKCIRDIHGVITRVSDEEAFRLVHYPGVAELYEYIPKHMWKQEVRDA